VVRLMAWHRRLGHRDANHGEVVRALECAGYSVVDLAKVGGGKPDILAGAPWGNVLMEIKTDDGELEAVQIDFISSWPNHVFVVRSGAEAVAAMEKSSGLRRKNP